MPSILLHAAGMALTLAVGFAAACTLIFHTAPWSFQ